MKCNALTLSDQQLMLLKIQETLFWVRASRVSYRQGAFIYHSIVIEIRKVLRTSVEASEVPFKLENQTEKCSKQSCNAFFRDVIPAGKRLTSLHGNRRQQSL